MHLHVDRKEETLAVIEIAASPEELAKIKNKVLRRLQPQVKVAGFRAGHVPVEVVEKNIDQQTLVSNFIDEAVNTLYIEVLRAERLRPVASPKVEVSKFVPYTTLEVKLELPVVGEVHLSNYRKLSVKKPEVKVTAKEVNQVLENLARQASTKKKANRAAKNGDEAIIDFKGVDKKGEAIAGADGKGYPLVLGSGTFIPGFEENVIGMKPDETKTFVVTFPKDYGAQTLRNAKVEFTVTLKELNEVELPKIDDSLAAKVSPFKTLSELKKDIKQQLSHEAAHKAERDWEAALVEELSNKTKVEIPKSLIEEQEEAVIAEVKQNAVSRGLTYTEYLKQLGLTEEEYRKTEVNKEAVRRIKAGLVLSEIADIEGIDVTPEELEVRIQALKAQYQDKQMQEQLDLPDNRRELNARLRSEKTIEFLKTQK